MSNIETPDYDIDHETYSERGESSVKATFPARIVERIETDWDDRYDADTKKYGDSYREIAHEGEYIVHQRLGNSLVNIDAYFDRDTAFEEPDTWNIEGRRHKRQNVEPGHREAQRLGEPELTFDLYESELIEAAKQRALEDSTHHIRVLAEWLYRAAPATDRDLYDKWAARPIKNALLDEAEQAPHVHWALAWGGDPDEYRGDEPPVGRYGADDDELAAKTSLTSELAAYAHGGMAAVEEAREKAAKMEVDR